MTATGHILLRAEMEARGITQEALSLTLECAQVSVSGWLRQKWSPGVVMRQKLQETLGIPVDAWDRPRKTKARRVPERCTTCGRSWRPRKHVHDEAAQ